MADFAITPADLKGLTKAQAFAKVADAAGVPVATMQGLYRVESSSGTDPKAFVPNPFSSAQGGFQITDPALQDVQKATGQIIDRNDFAQSLYAAGHIMYTNMKAFNGDVNLATAAYNQGRGNARSAAGQAYANKVNGTDEPLETFSNAQNPNIAMASVLFAPQLQGAMGDIAPRDLANALAGKQPKEVLSKTAQAAQLLSQGEVANAGGSVQEVVNAGEAGKQLGPEQQLNQVVNTSAPKADASTSALDFMSDSDYALAVDGQQLIDGTSAGRAFVDSALQNNIVARMAQNFRDDYVANQTRDPNWVYTPEQDEADRKAGYSEVEMDRLRNAVSDQDYAYRKQEIQDDRDSQFNLSQHGLAGFAGGITGGLLDPVQWVIGGGVGAGISASVRATTLAARLAVASAAGGVSNVAITAALDAAGQNLTTHDYVMAGLTGATLGAVGGVFHAGVSGSLERLRRSMAQAKADLHVRAADELGPGATPDQIQARATQLEQMDFEQREALRNQINLAPIPDDQRIQPGNLATGDTGTDTFLTTQPSPNVNPDRIDAVGQGADGTQWRSQFSVQDDGKGGFMLMQHDGQGRAAIMMQDGSWKEATNGLPTGGLPMPFATRDAARAGLTDAVQQLGGVPGRTVLDDVLDRYPGLRTINDEVRMRMAAETIARAELNDRLRPIDEAKLARSANVLSNLPESLRQQLETFGMALARSENPVARWVSGNLMESAAGTSSRVRTASITKTQLENISREQWGQYNAVRELYRHETGGGFVGEFLRGDSRNAFDRQVADEVNRRRFNPKETDELAGIHQRVREGADALERIYQQQLDWQKSAKTLGWEHLPDSARGYMPQRVNMRRILGASADERNAFVRAVTTQLLTNNENIDQALAQSLANEYVQHAIQRGVGAVERPTNLISDDLSDQISEALDRLGVSGNEAAVRLQNKYQRGGASYTKQRYNFDMNQQVTDTTNLGDYFVSDQDSLFQRYMARNSGEVALARYGVYGQPGIAALRDAMTQVYDQAGIQNHAHELEVFDSFMRDMLGQPLSGQGATPGAIAAQTFRQLTSMNLLGGMSFTQAGEMANLATTLGIDQALRSIPLVRQLFKDVRLMKSNGLFDQLEVIGGRNGASEMWHFPYEQSPDDLRIYGYDTPGIARRAMANASRAFQVVNGHRMVHEWQMRVATEQLASKVLRAANGTAKLTKLTQEMGFNAGFLERLKADLPNIAEFDGKWVKNLDLSKTQDPTLMNEFIQGVQRGAKQIIQGSFRGEHFKAQTSLIGQMLTQFRTFSFLAMEKQWARAAGTVGVPMATAAMIGQMMAAVPVQLARVHLNAIGKDPQKREEYIANATTPAALALATMNYSGLTGLMGDFLGAGFNAYAAATGEDLRRSEFVGHGATSPQAWSVGSVIPAVAYGDSVLKNAYGFTRKPSFANAAKFGRSVLPGANIPYFAFAMNAAQQE